MLTEVLNAFSCDFFFLSWQLVVVFKKKNCNRSCHCSSGCSYCMVGLWLDQLTDTTKRSPCSKAGSPVQHRALYPCKATACVSIKELQNLNLHLHGESQFPCGSLLIEDDAVQYISTVSGSGLLGLYFFTQQLLRIGLKGIFFVISVPQAKLFVTVRNLCGNILAFEQNSVHACTSENKAFLNESLSVSKT